MKGFLFDYLQRHSAEVSEYSVPGKKSKTGEINKLEWVLSFQGV